MNINTVQIYIYERGCIFYDLLFDNMLMISTSVALHFIYILILSTTHRSQGIHVRVVITSSIQSNDTSIEFLLCIFTIKLYENNTHIIYNYSLFGSLNEWELHHGINT